MWNPQLLWDNLFKPQTRPRFAWPEALALAAYCAILFWCIPHHASWFDEAETWLIARSSTISDMLLHRLHYEGNPAIWYLLAWTEIRLHVSFLGMHLIAGAIAATGIYVWLRFNPLPRILSLLVPFSFFLLYQYAVVARCYAFLPLLAFSLMILYRNRNSSPLLFALLAGFMANCSGHMAAYAVGMVIWYGRDRWLSTQQNKAERRALLAPALIFVACLSLAAATAWPSPDGSFGSDKPSIELLRHVGHDRGRPAGSTSQSAATRPSEPPTIVKALVRLLTVLTVPISTVNLLTLLFFLLLGINLYRQKLWLSLLPSLMAAMLYEFLHGASHHTGIVWIGLLCCLWQLASEPPPEGGKQWLRPALYAVTGVVVVLQIGWSIHCIRNDFDGAYSGYRATADYLRQLHPGTRIAAFGMTTATVNAYFPHTPFYNTALDYSPLSKTTDPDLDFDQVIAERPAVVVAQEQDYISQIQNQWITTKKGGLTADDIALADKLIQHGYHATHRFCGDHAFRDTTEFKDCAVIYEPNQSTQP
jgi:hypothetical protein